MSYTYEYVTRIDDPRPFIRHYGSPTKRYTYLLHTITNIVTI